MQKFVVTQNGKTLLTVTATAFTNERIAKLIKLAKRDFGYNLKFYIDGIQVDIMTNIINNLLKGEGKQVYKYYLNQIAKQQNALNALIYPDTALQLISGFTITDITLKNIFSINALTGRYCTDKDINNAFSVFN